MGGDNAPLLRIEFLILKGGEIRLDQHTEFLIQIAAVWAGFGVIRRHKTDLKGRDVERLRVPPGGGTRFVIYLMTVQHSTTSWSASRRRARPRCSQERTLL